MAARKKHIVWIPHQDPYKRARAEFSVAHMSNAKWRKVLRAIATCELQLSRSEWKCIDTDHVMIQGIPQLRDIMENRFADGPFQPVDYKWLEWVRFPRTYRPYPGEVYEVAQDVDGLKRVLESCGKLQLRLDEDGLTLFAYGR
jgi:hypothetical protein